MITPTREEILLVLKGSYSDTSDETLGKWTSPFTAARFKIVQSENDFMLRISSDSQPLSDPLVFTSTRNISSVKKLSETLLQVNLRVDPPVARNVKFCMQFNLPRDQDHFFLILKNAAEELKSRGLPAPMAARAATVPLVGPSSGLESPAKGSEIESLINDLQRNVAGGDNIRASEAAASLAKKRTKLSISVDEIGDMPGFRSKFTLEVCVEDRQSSGAKITLFDVTPNMTIGFLKKKVFQQYKFPVEVQHWIIGRRIIKDYETLMECRINSSTPVFLYLISAEKAGITREEVEMSRQAMAQQMQFVMHPMPAMVPPIAQQQKQTAPNPGPRLPSRVAPREAPKPSSPRKPTAEQVGWHCPFCTLINPPTVPGCRACMAERPKDYVIPNLDSYVMDPEEKAKQDELQHNERLMEELEKKQKREEQASRDSNYQALLMTDTVDLISNAEAFECLICYGEVQARDGVLLRECLHTFCKDCLKSHILHNREPVIMCPYNDGTYTCPEALLEREIKALISPEDFAQYLQRGLTVAESQDPNSFHCKTPDCLGFCFYDDNINFFQCPICGKENCLTCKAIHQGMNCKEYQDDLQRRAANDKAALMTKNMLEKMIASGEAMKCPQCSIIMVKKEGCDWIQCSMCKLEVCWVTKGPRWGPKGTGDISGGCKCRVQAKRCHPNCQNCH